MGVIRGAVGFLGFFAAFAFRDDKPVLGLVGMFAVAGAFAGNLLAPSLRQLAREEVMVAGALLTAATAAVLGGLAGGTFGVGIAALFIAIGSASGKLGFDSLLQRDGPDAVRGRAFAMFEARFQMFWCVGALLGLIPIGEKLGLLVLGSVLAFGGVSYVAGLRAAWDGSAGPSCVPRPSTARSTRRARTSRNGCASAVDPGGVDRAVRADRPAAGRAGATAGARSGATEVPRGGGSRRPDRVPSSGAPMRRDRRRRVPNPPTSSPGGAERARASCARIPDPDASRRARLM